MMKVALGEFSSYVLNGQRVIPKVLLEKGFKFDYPTIKGALEDLL